MMHSLNVLADVSGHGFALAAFWVSTLLIFYTYFGYPLLLQAIALMIRRRDALPSTQPRLTVVICAHNEARSIAVKLNDTLALDYPRDRLQIIVASDGSTDETDAIVESFKSRGVKLVRIHLQAGKTHAQNVAVSYATGEIIVFSDATTRYHPRALQFLAGSFVDPLVGAVSGRYVYVDDSGQVPTGGGAQTFASYDNQVRSLQSRVGSITGCCGCIYAVRRSLYTPLANHIISDLVQPLHVLRKGFTVKLEPRALAWEVSTLTSRREFSMRVRVVARALGGLFSVDELLMPWRFPWIAIQIWSHKLLRWAVPVLLLTLMLSSAALRHTPIYGAAFIAQIGLYLAALLALVVPLHRRWPFLGLPLYFCTINAAAVAGFLQFIRGQRYTAWRPERDDAHAT